MALTNVHSSASSDKTSRRKVLAPAPPVALVGFGTATMAVPAMADDAYLDGLLAAHAAAEAEAKASDTSFRTPAYEAAARRCKERYDAIMKARPTDPITMAKQIRFLVLGSRHLKSRTLRHIANQLESMPLASPVERGGPEVGDDREP
jgi:hypothetical protein